MNYDDGKQPIVIRSSTGASKVLFQRDSCSISLPESKARVSELLTEASNARSWLDGILVAFIRSFLLVIQRISSWSVRQRGECFAKEKRNEVQSLMGQSVHEYDVIQPTFQQQHKTTHPSSSPKSCRVSSISSSTSNNINYNPLLLSKQGKRAAVIPTNKPSKNESAR